MRRNRSLSVAVVVFALTVGLTACGDDGGSKPNVEATSANTPDQPAAPPEVIDEPAPIIPRAPYGSYIDLSNKAYKARLTILTSDILRPQPGMVSGQMSLDDCEVDPKRDAVVAYTISVQNTSSVTVPVAYGLHWDIDRGALPGDPDTSRVQITTAFSLGGDVKCYDEFSSRTGGVFGLESDSVGPNDTMDVSGFFILKKFFSAQYPKGDFGSVKSARIVMGQLVADGAPRLGWKESNLGTMEKLSLHEYEHRFGARMIGKLQVGTA